MILLEGEPCVSRAGKEPNGVLQSRHGLRRGFGGEGEGAANDYRRLDWGLMKAEKRVAATLTTTMMNMT
jgi:hypothetical protein